MRLIDADALIEDMRKRKYIDKALCEIFETVVGEAPTVFESSAVYRKMWRESEEVCGNTMIETDRATEIIAEALSGGVE